MRSGSPSAISLTRYEGCGIFSLFCDSIAHAGRTVGPAHSIAIDKPTAALDQQLMRWADGGVREARRRVLDRTGGEVDH